MVDERAKRLGEWKASSEDSDAGGGGKSRGTLTPPPRLAQQCFYLVSRDIYKSYVDDLRKI